eukprot:4666579-Prorocentrum_lima.AAC.1
MCVGGSVYLPVQASAQSRLLQLCQGGCFQLAHAPRGWPMGVVVLVAPGPFLAKAICAIARLRERE